MIKLIKEAKLYNAGYVQMWDFSEANANEANRIEAVTTVANVCRGDKGVKNPEELYKQLLTEHDGKCGSVFEFVPVSSRVHIKEQQEYLNMIKYGYKTDCGEFFDICYSNLRAAMADNINIFNPYQRDGFFVFKVKVPQMIVKHILRHRMLSFQEMSERTNKLREYYYCDEFRQIFEEEYGYLSQSDKELYTKEEYWNMICYNASQSEFDNWQRQYKIRQELLNKGSHGLAYTTLWIAGWKQDLKGWDNFFAVRTKKPAQREIIELAEVIKQMMEQ